MRDQFKQIREEIEARQRSILWPDYLYATRNVFDFLWNGSPNPNMIQRAGLALFGLHFLAFGVGFISISFSIGMGWFNPPFAMGGVGILFSLRVLRNAFTRSSHQNLKETERDDD